MEVGPHLLGRNPSPPDRRDWQLEPFLAAAETGDPLDLLLAALEASHAAKATKAWAALATARIKAASPAPPAPPGPPQPSPQGDIIWADIRQVLNQGQTPHCVGFGWAQWGNSAPIEDIYADVDGHTLYAECKAIDGEPGQQNGSNVRSGAKAMQARGRLAGYAFAASMETARQWVVSQGPVVLGTNWTRGMFTPDADGTVHATGPVDGGHCYLWIGDRPEMAAAECLNSWGPGWAQNGRFFIPYADLAVLLAAQGEACAALELA